MREKNNSSKKTEGRPIIFDKRGDVGWCYVIGSILEGRDEWERMGQLYHRRYCPRIHMSTGAGHCHQVSILLLQFLLLFSSSYQQQQHIITCFSSSSSFSSSIEQSSYRFSIPTLPPRPLPRVCLLLPLIIRFSIY